MIVMYYLNKECYEDDYNFRKCINKIKKMKKYVIKENNDYSYISCDGRCSSGNCVFSEKCDYSKNTLEFIKEINKISTIEETYDFIIKSLLKEYSNYRKNKKTNDLKPSDSEGDKLQVVVPNNHYKTKIEPLDYIMKNGFDFVRGNIIKYASRAGKKKGEEVNDIKKIIDYALILAKQENINIDFEDIKKLVDYRKEWKK